MSLRVLRVYFIVAVTWNSFEVAAGFPNSTSNANLNVRSKDDEKSSLVFVFDTTGSMYNDLRQLRESAEMILDTALEESNIIADFVFVPFHDPGVGPPTVTRHKAVFKAALNIVRVYGGGDCPEKSLTGINMALEVSRPRSFVYVFTDATAGDHRLVGKVLDMVQRKQSQVVFVLTGHCNDLQKPSYQVYEQIAAASSGQVFNLNKTNVHNVLEMVRTSIRGRNVNLGSSVLPAGYNHTQEIPVDSTVGEVTVSVSGSKPQIKVVDPKGEELTGPPKLITTLDLSEIMVVKVLQPEPGNWSITVGSERDYSVKVVGMSNLTFTHGFSVRTPASMKETSHRPLKGTYNHMMISLSETDTPVKVEYVEILSLNGQILFELPLKEVDNHNRIYLADAFVPPDDFFYVAINGHVNNQELRRVGATAVQAKLPDVPYLTAPRQLSGRVGSRVSLRCDVESLVPVAAVWTRSDTKLQPYTSTLQSTSIEYVIEDMREQDADTYRCVAHNSAGVTTADTHLQLTVDPPEVNIGPGNITVLYGDTLVVSCEVYSDVLPQNIQLIFKGTNHVDDDVMNVYISPKENGLYKYNKTILQVTEDDSGSYTCAAVNKGGRTTKSMNVTVQTQPSVQILGPHNVRKLKYSDVQLICHVENADTVQWVAPNKTVVMDTGVNATYDGMFDVKNITEGGNWTCVGSRGPYRASDAMFIDILIAPTVVIEGERNITVLEGTSVDVKCLVTARPMPRVIWHRETETFLDHTITPLYNNMYRSVLTLNSSKEPVNATYFCIGENSEGIAEDSIMVNLRRKMTLVKGFTDKSVELYSQAELQCHIDSHPTPLVTWYHNGTKLSPTFNVQISDDGTTVYLLMVDFDNLGTYVCEADNGYETVKVNGTLTVIGLESPKLSKEPKSVAPLKGTSTNLTCRLLKGKPEPLLSWRYRNESSRDFYELPFGVLLNNDGSELSIPKLDVEHNGIYRCIAENVLNTDYYDVRLIIQYPPQMIGSSDELSHQDGPIEKRVGENLRLSCKTTGVPPPIVVWTKEQRPLAYTSNVYLANGNDLVIDKVSVYDTGLYTCSAISPLGSSQKNFTVFVYAPPSIVPTDTDPEVQVLEGQLVYLPCSASGTPSPRVLWRRDGTLINGRKHIEETGIRFVANLTDFGNYTCFVENDYGNTSVSYFVYVWVAPSVKPLETSKTVRIGENVTLQCDAVGFPIPFVTWEFQDSSLDANTTNLRFNDVGNLFITNVSVHQEGRYVCIANNVAGEDRKTIYLNVHEPPKIIEPNDKSFLATNRDMEVVISCNATGKPKPFIAWIREGYYIDNDSNFAVDYDGTLTIKSPSEELSGQYTCVAKNTAGEANKTIPVDIYSIPTHMQSEESHTKIVVVEGTNASVECPLHASRKDIVKWYKDAKMVSTGVLQIMNVTRQNSSEYMCVVHNVAGSALARVLVDVQWPPRLQLHTNNTIQVDVIKGNDWYFDCAADASPRAKTKWLFNKKPMVFEDRDRLKILNVGEKHAGNYQCIVTNIHGTISNTYVLNVLVPPIISEFDLFEVQLKENSDAALECNAKGLPVPDIKWTFNNSEWNIEGSTLISRNVSVDAGGLFRCSASNSAGTTTLTYNVTIVSGARIQEIVLYSQGEGQTILTRAEVKKDTRVRMSCKASGQPVPKIQWIKTGNVLSENEYNISYADLVLDDVQTVQSGIYSCVVINEGGMDEKKFRLDVLVPPKIFNTLFENGNSTGNTVNLEVLLGQSFSMHCHPYGNPVPEVYWFKDGLPLRLFDDSMLSTDFSEVIVSNKALYEQSGNYTCVARNNVGNTSFVYLVEVLVPPPIPKDTVRISATRVGHTLNLTCPVEGSPTPVVTWLRQPYVELGEDTPRVSLLNDNVTLLINKTEVSDSGKYSCVMTNKVGTTEIVFDVTIDMPPSIAGNVGNDIVENHVVPLMRSIVLKCEVKGHPAPWIAWLKDTQRIPNDSSNIQHVFGSSLLGVWRVTSKAAGQYVCVAENNAGAAHRRYNVAVQVPGKWSAWSKWGFCNTTCGLGYQHRHRICQYIDDDNVTYDKTTKSDKVVLDMSECKGSEVDKRRCHMPPCEEPAIARWSPWSPWSSCSATCGSGTQARTRRCKSTRPCYGTNVQDPYMPEEIYEMEPEVVSMNKNKPPDVEEFDVKTAPRMPSEVFFDVPVTSNLDFSDPGPCRPGFIHNNTFNTCDDIDECGIEYNQCHVTQVCVNTRGGYRCGCEQGYTSLGAGQRCLDVNECEQEIDGCEFACVNVAGGYVCACPRHLRLHLDKHHCVTPSAYRQPLFDELDTGDYLSAFIDFSTNNRKGRG